MTLDSLLFVPVWNTGVFKILIVVFSWKPIYIIFALDFTDQSMLNPHLQFENSYVPETELFHKPSLTSSSKGGYIFKAFLLIFIRGANNHGGKCCPLWNNVTCAWCNSSTNRKGSTSTWCVVRQDKNSLFFSTRLISWPNYPSTLASLSLKKKVFTVTPMPCGCE